MIFRLAFRNLVSAGLRTWLNVAVLTMVYLVIVWLQGLYLGMNDQASRAMIDGELAGGQYWQKTYDPLDPLSLEDAHAPLPQELTDQIESGELCPILITKGTIYPEGRIQSVLLKGLPPQQRLLDLPSKVLANSEEIPAASILHRRCLEVGRRASNQLSSRWCLHGDSCRRLRKKSV